MSPAALTAALAAALLLAAGPALATQAAAPTAARPPARRPAGPPATAPQPAGGPGPEEVAAAEAGPLAVAPFSISLGAGHHSLYRLGGWVTAARGGVRLSPRGPLALGPFVPELSLQATYGRTVNGVGLGRFLAGVTWWREAGRLHAGLGAAAGYLWLDGPGRLNPGLMALVEAAVGVEVARVAGARVSFDLRGGLDPRRPSEPEALAVATIRY